MAKKIVFPKNALTTVRIRYEAPYNREIAFDVRQDVAYFCLGPGQYWKGDIGTAEVVLENPDSGGNLQNMVFRNHGTTPIKKTITEARIKYELRQLVPLTNEIVIFGQIPTRHKVITKGIQ
jgi:hypothetical protein